MEIETQQDIRSVPAENLAPQSGASTLDATAHCRRTMLKFGLGALVARTDYRTRAARKARLYRSRFLGW